MISKNRLKDLSAYRQQKRCDEEAVFVVEGVKMAAEAMASGMTVRVVCATAEWLASHSTEGSEAEVCEVSQAELERISGMKTPNQVWMLVERPNTAAFHTPQDSLVLALDRVQDPGNLGTIMRTADWFGLRRIVCSHDTVSCYNPKVVQASMGAVFRTAVEYTDLPAWLDACGMQVYGASLHGVPLHEAPRPQMPAVLLLGNEGRGIGDAAMARVTNPVTIPNIGQTAESLNVSAAAAIFMSYYIYQ